MHKVLALTVKDLRLMIRDKAGFFFIFFFPLLFAIFFGVIFSGEGGSSAIPIAMVDEDSSANSAKFIATLAAAPEINVLQTTRADAVDKVRRGKRAAYIVLHKGFGEASERMFWGDPAEVEIGLDPSRKAEAGMLQGVLTRYFMEGLTASFTDPTQMRRHFRQSQEKIKTAPEKDKPYWTPLSSALTQLDSFFAQSATDSVRDSSSAQNKAKGKGWEPLKVVVSDVAVNQNGPKNPFDVTFPQAAIWAMIGCAAAFGISLVTERRGGTLMRLHTAPLSRWQILAGKAVACFITIVTVSLALFLFASVIFHIRVGSILMLLLAIISAGICFVGIMMLLSVMGKTEASAGGIGWAVLLVMSMIGGGMIPLLFMPAWMQTFSSISPVKWAILTIEGAVWRGFSPELMLTHCGILVAIGLVCFIIGARVFQWTEG
ncbi:MAG: ABC transporter permease [bacterium]|nr:ABC transporter permease [bacterium]